MKKYFFLLTGCMLLFVYTFAQRKQDKQLEKNLDQLLSAQFKIADPGGEILVARQGKIVYQKAFGSADLELNVPLKPGMVFKLASITKQFTAVAILQLAEQGKLNIKDSLQVYLKDYPSKNHSITIENLLTHTSGIPDYTQLEYEDKFAERRDYEPLEVISKFKDLPLQFEPGTQYRYSNSGYFLLGYIIEKISGKSFATYLQENILTPLSLNDTYFDQSNIVIPGRVKGYRKDGSVFRNADYWSTTIAYSAGGLISNADDLFKWHKGLYSYKILRKETLDQAFIPFKLKDGTVTEYGYGWILKNISCIQSIEHAGAITGFRTNEMYFPSEDVFVVALFNCECAAKDELSINIASLALGKPLQIDLKVNTALFDEYVGTYTLSTDKKRTIIVSKEKDGLIAELSGQGIIQVIFQTDTKFQLRNVLGATCEFIKENGKVTKIIVSQNGIFEWIKNK